VVLCFIVNKSINDAWCEFLIVSFAVLYIEDHLADVPGVVLWFDGFLVDEVSLQRGVFDVKNLSIKLFQVCVGHLGPIQSQPVPEDDLEFFGAEMATAVVNLAEVSISFCGFGRVLVAKFSEYTGHVVVL